MTQERIEELQKLLHRQHEVKKEVERYNSILNSKQEDCGLEIYVSGWTESELVAAIHRPMPDVLWEAFRTARNQAAERLAGIDREIAEF